jgi:dihydropteroate synthase
VRDAPVRAHDPRLRLLGAPDPGRALALEPGARGLGPLVTALRHGEPGLAAEMATALAAFAAPPSFSLPEATLAAASPEAALPLGRRTLLMGILNVTPDSFSDGGRFARPRAAVRQALRMAGEGADLIDVGGESTRPGSQPVSLGEELRRVMPVLEALQSALPRKRQGGPWISIDTTKAEVARRAALAGAVLLNDISGMTFDPAMPAIAAEHRLGVVLQHLRGRPATMQRAPRYRLLFPEVTAFLRAAAARAVRAGVPQERLVVDPGLGFGKKRVHNLALLRHLTVLRSLGRPILVGASRKSFLRDDRSAAAASRLEAGLAAQALALAGGADIIRTHDVREAARVARLCDAVLRGQSDS